MYQSLHRLCVMAGIRLPPSADMDGLRICVLYGITSVVISLIYKSVLSGYGYSATFTMLATQLVLSLTFCFAAKRWASHIPSLHVPDIDKEILRKSILPGVVFVCNIVVGWYGLKLVNVPMFLAIRRTNAAFTLVAEAILLKQVQPLNVNIAVLVIVLGAAVAGFPSLQADWLGFLYTLGNNAFTATSMSLTKKFSNETKIQGLGIVLYNAVIALPLCIVGAVVTGEFEYTFGAGSDFKHGYDPNFWLSLVFASSIGVFMSYIVFLCTTVNSPLATSITGNLKDIASTVIAAVLFRDFQPTLFNMVGLTLSFVGAGWFSWLKLNMSRQQANTAKINAYDEKQALGANGKSAIDDTVIEIPTKGIVDGNTHRTTASLGKH